MINTLYTKEETLRSKIAYVPLLFTLLLFSTISVFVNYNNDIAVAGFVPVKNIVIAINPGASDERSQNPYNSTQVIVPARSNVTWINNDNSGGLHTITSGDPEKGPSNIFYSPNIDVGENFTYTFDNPGVYPYYDRNYPHMTGQVTVEDK